MSLLSHSCRILALVTICLFGMVQGNALAQPVSDGKPVAFPRGSFTNISQLPPGRFRSELEQLPPTAAERARNLLAELSFTEKDIESLHSDTEGSVYFSCTLTGGETAAEGEPVTSEAAVPVSPFPANLIFHSRPGSPNVLYLNFTGEVVTNTAWNSGSSPSVFNAVTFSTDGDYSTFSDSEQLVIRRVWQRVSEDYAPFDIDVTTERPVTFNNRTVNALITRNTDANSVPNPSSSAGGVAYVNVFNNSNYSYYRPAWIYANNLGPGDESYISEAVSHEVGHNMGLSHDATSTSSYYNGHGSGETSWGPIMGTGYNRNVSQWCKGEYYDASQTQDDLAIISGKITYRVDDVGGTAVSARPIVLTGITNIVSTTPETDPTNTNQANKGVIERNTDVDVFSFVTGNGPVNIVVTPWRMPTARTLGGNLDVLLELRDSNGLLLLTNNPPTQTSASIQTNLPSGQYYLHIKNTGYGTPLNSPPSGYTSYGSIGQYFISGYVRDPSGVVIAPLAQASASDITGPGLGAKQFTVTYSDDFAVNVATIDSNDIRVTGPNGYNQMAQFVSLNLAGNGTPRTATYSVPPPNGLEWLPVDQGSYSINILSNQVADVEGAYVSPAQLTQFQVNVPVVIYAANMSTNPGWTLQPDWQYGVPSYGAGGPSGGYTGTSIIGYNLSGNFPNGMAVKYATTPIINASGSSSVTLQFRRWLRVRNLDSATIEASTNGVNWQNVWSSGGANVSDSSWQLVQYALPASFAGSSTLRLRWALSTGGNGGRPTDIGWNMDDIELLADGAIDVAAPVAVLSVGNVTESGAPSQSCSVTYTDETAVSLASLDNFDLLVTGPNSYSNGLVFVGADLPGDGSPLTGSYDIPAPGGSWDISDNGSYTITLLSGQVSDTGGNTIPGHVLGGFSVAIPQVPLFAVTLSVAQAGLGTVAPSNGFYPQGTNLQLIATPANYYAFDHWAGDTNSTSNPVDLVVGSDFTAEAVFTEVLTTNHPTPHWWLAQYGYTNNFESVVEQLGGNGVPLWQSYIAGLNPTNPASRLTLGIAPLTNGSGLVLSWNAVTGRVYTIWTVDQAGGALSALAGASNLAPPINEFTNLISPSDPLRFFRLEVQKP